MTPPKRPNPPARQRSAFPTICRHLWLPFGNQGTLWCPWCRAKVDGHCALDGHVSHVVRQFCAGIGDLSYVRCLRCGVMLDGAWTAAGYSQRPLLEVVQGATPIHAGRMQPGRQGSRRAAVV